MIFLAWKFEIMDIQNDGLEEVHPIEYWLFEMVHVQFSRVIHPFHLPTNYGFDFAEIRRDSPPRWMLQRVKRESSHLPYVAVTKDGLYEFPSLKMYIPGGDWHPGFGG